MALGRLILSLLLVCVAVLGLSAFSVGIAMVNRYAHDLPDHSELANYVPSSGSIVLAADGTLIARHTDQRRTYVPIEDIPDLVVQAFVSAEDKNYWTHSGIDPVAIARAAIGNVLTGRMVGASTITQQVAKNLVVGDDLSLERKIREALLAMRMDTDIGKAHILEIYLNEIYLGIGAYGVGAAAQTFFSKELDELTLAEAALLAAMPKAPSSFDPRRNPERVTVRRNYVLGRMVEDGYVTPEAAEAASARPIALDLDLDPRGEGQIRGAWFVDDAWQSVAELPAVQSYTGGDVVLRSTLRPSIQSAATAALVDGILEEDRRLGWRGVIGTTVLPVDWDDPALVPPEGSEAFTLGVVAGVGTTAAIVTRDGEVLLDAEAVAWTGSAIDELLDEGDIVLLEPHGDSFRLGQMPEVEGAMVVLDPRAGDILALVGGFSHARSVFDRVVQAHRQPGSAFKPLVYLSALELGYDPTSPLLDASITLEQGPGQEDWRPDDARGAGGGGLITLRHALEVSRNMASVRLLWDLGLDTVADTISRLGIDMGPDMTYAIGLGAGEVTPLELALAYGTMVNGGHALTPRFVTAVETREGAPLVAIPDGVGAQVVDPIATAQITSMLRGVVERGTAKSPFVGFERWIGGKTGTTNGSRDAWFVGVASDLVVVIWIGRDDNRPLADGASGSRTAATIARDFLDAVGDAFMLGRPPLPEDGIEWMRVDPETGLQTSSDEGILEIVREGWYVIDQPVVSVETGEYVSVEEVDG